MHQARSCLRDKSQRYHTLDLCRSDRRNLVQKISSAGDHYHRKMVFLARHTCCANKTSVSKISTADKCSYRKMSLFNRHALFVQTGSISACLHVLGAQAALIKDPYQLFLMCWVALSAYSRSISACLHVLGVHSALIAHGRSISVL